jgi:hypothetical protein
MCLVQSLDLGQFVRLEVQHFPRMRSQQIGFLAFRLANRVLVLRDEYFRFFSLPRLSTLVRFFESLDTSSERIAT